MAKQKGIGPFHNKNAKPFEQPKPAPTFGYSKADEPAPVIGLQNTRLEDQVVEDLPAIVVVIDNCVVVNVRTMASKTSDVEAVVPKGTRFVLISQSNGWAYLQGIENPSLIGYVMDRYIVGE